MSTVIEDSGGSNIGFNPIVSPHPTSPRSSSIGITESNPDSLPINQMTINQATWISRFNVLDFLFSGSSLNLMYRFIDITLLFIGLLSNKPKCSASNHLAITSICLIIFYFIDLFIIFIFFIRNLSLRHVNLTEEQKLEELRRASMIRAIFMFFKIIPICFGTGYSFSSTLSNSTDCELMRVCLGIVCLSTWLFVLMPPVKPEPPLRRSLVAECFVLLFVLAINGTYIGTVANAITDVDNSTCIYNGPEDFYSSSPLKSFAVAGLILFSCTTMIHIINLVINQICFRSNRQRTFYMYYHALHYIINYIGTIFVIYYFSVGAIWLFQPRSGQPCRESAPNLYKVLLIWEWIRILSPLFIVPLIMILCCLGVFFGIMLSYCLPASITVPILEILQRWGSATPMAMHPNPPATQENIDSVPVVLFGQEPDRFNQVDCAICRTAFESNEELKKLQCGHVFHPECVANWLRVTRICPICRQRMGTTNP